MRRRRARGGSSTMGEAMSVEDVLTVITVLLLLRIVFMVPLVNLDKAKTVAAKADLYWSHQALQTLAQPSDSVKLNPYRVAFNLQEAVGCVTTVRDRLFLEAAFPDSSLLIIRHTPGESGFVALRVQAHGHARSFRRGRLLWSESEHEWFIESDTLDYGTHPTSLVMEKAFRSWTKTARGY